MQRKYIKIPNEIFEELARTRFSNYEFRYLFILIRKTLGWNKESDWISNSQFVKETGIRKQHISRVQKGLLDRKIVTKLGNKLKLNLNYGAWLGREKGLKEKTEKLPIEVTPLKINNSSKKVTNVGYKVTNLGAHKEQLNKEQEEESLSSNKETKSLISFYKQFILEEYSISLEVNYPSCIKRLQSLLNRKNDKWEIAELKEALKFYLHSEKAKKFGYGMTTALSVDSLNKFKSQKQKLSDLYVK